MEKLGLALVCLLLPILIKGASSTTFTLKNNCPHKIWPAALSSSGSLPTTGFELQSGSTLKIQAPPKWSGRFWPRTNCSTDASSEFSCLSGDCGGGKPECAGTGGAPPASLAEFTLQGHDNKDFYDISLVDGYNVPVTIVPRGVPECNSTGCGADINRVCPPELQARSPDGVVLGCKSACLVFGEKEYCCSDDYNDPKVCKPTNYSKIFKDACPQAYSYPYDDATSTFTCTGADYDITFCP
ncbi:thaumatin-like protein 1b [Asparagus officinalis]|uniref:thaumatin-like protein 1b n=1 Tax=Asparagus officinalis TaxID=4686 RepID=UPI00098DF4D8|nr:thaumatin-like protein 1b [Asparagus officinalis]